MQCSIHGIFLGLECNQKSYVFFSPGSHQIYICSNVMFDESFGTAIAASWRLHQDSLSLRPLWILQLSTLGRGMQPPMSNNPMTMMAMRTSETSCIQMMIPPLLPVNLMMMISWMWKPPLRMMTMMILYPHSLSNNTGACSTASIYQG